jgi:bifunctional NMN adenylyltransferase/nudix hydrolase
MAGTGVFIARFQVAEVTDSYRKIIKNISEKHEHVAFVIGATKVLGSSMNPLEADLRTAMLKEEFPSYAIYTIDDHPSDETWSQNLDNVLKEKVGLPSDVVLYGSEDRFIKHYYGGYPSLSTGDTPFKHLSKDSAEALKNTNLNSKEFREGIVYASANTFPKVYPTVDIAVFRKQKTEVLLGMKALDKKWRFIGGFTDPEDTNYEHAAKRELEEECGKLKTSLFTFEGSYKVDDWRYRNERDKIITSFFSCEHLSGKPEAADDIAEVKWVTLTDLQRMKKSNQTAPEHEPLIDSLLKKYL